MLCMYIHCWTARVSDFGLRFVTGRGKGFSIYYGHCLPPEISDWVEIKPAGYLVLPYPICFRFNIPLSYMKLYTIIAHNI